MKNLWIRLGIVVGVLVVIIAGVSTLATPDLEKKDTFSCGYLRHHGACTTTCEDSVYTHGHCHDNRNKVAEFITVQCCCCTEGWQHSSFEE